jgi:hypothetical protein
VRLHAVGVMVTVALTHILLTRPGSALYASRYPEELYDRVREALLAL